MFKLFHFLTVFLLLVVVSSQFSVAQAEVYANAKGLDKTEALVGGEVGILGENFTQTGTKKCMPPGGTSINDQFDCNYQARVILARKIGKSVTNHEARITSFSSTKVTFKVPIIPSGEYMVYYQHYAPEYKQYTLKGMFKLNITNNSPSVPVASPKPSSSPVVTPSPSPSPIVEPSPVVSPSPSVEPTSNTDQENTIETTSQQSWFQRTTSGFVNWVKSWFRK